MNFKEIYYNAKLSSISYSHEDTLNGFLKDKEGEFVKFNGGNDLYLHFKQDKRVYIAIKGTSNLKNVIEDIDYKKKFNYLINCWVHEGFYKTALKIYDDLKAIYTPEDELHITGHSYGGAVAAILGMLFSNSHYSVSQIITFGQPKVTNKQGCQYFEKLPLIRVVNNHDPVTTVPPRTLLSWWDHGFYKHFGTMVRIKKDFSLEIVKDGSISFFHNLFKLKLDDHRMERYKKGCKNLIK